MKVFFMTTHANQGTGYARIANKITNYLADLPGVEVVFYAFQNYPGQDIKDRFIDPRIKFIDALVEDSVSPKGFGDKGIVPAIEREKPDVLFLYNDLPVSTSILDMIPADIMPAKKYIYLDIVYPWQTEKYYSKLRNHNVDHIWVFLECWRKHMVDDLQFDRSKVSVLVHGVDFERFVHTIPAQAKKELGFAEDDFVVLNMNRNSYRKQWCTTIEAFLDFLKLNDMNPKIKLYCGCMMMTDDGYDIPRLIIKNCIQRGLDPSQILNTHIYKNPKPLHLTDEEVNRIYNAADVGMNTCCGEGFGLTTMEHAYFNRPQIVAGVPALKETLGEHAHVVEPKVWTTISNFESHSGDIAIFDSKDFADRLDWCFKNKRVLNTADFVKKTYSWDIVFAELDKWFKKD